jgi:hypothetical protein
MNHDILEAAVIFSKGGLVREGLRVSRVIAHAHDGIDNDYGP